jgi:hypothetical protein
MTAFSQSLTPDVVAAGGDYYVTNTGSLSWTLGEAVIETVSNNETTFTQGFQQSLYEVVDIEDVKDDSYTVFVYPVPASDFLNIDITSQDKTVSLNVELFDIAGNKLYEQAVQSSSFHENMSLTKYRSNSLVLKITNTKNQIVKTFKILKVPF